MQKGKKELGNFETTSDQVNNSPEHRYRSHEKAREILSRISVQVEEAQKKIDKIQGGNCRDCSRTTLKFLDDKIKSLRVVENRILRRKG